ncbi:thioesterase [Spirochaetia bacterium]|nr:thioesterase [Spirochaetia bacterium]
MACEYKLRVRTYECDSYGHVNNANYLNFLEVGRFEYLRQVGFDYKELLVDGYGIFVARIEIDYKRPAVADDEIVITTWPIKKGAVSVAVGQRITRGSDIIVEAKVNCALVDAKGTPTRLPEKYNVPGLNPEPTPEIK